MLNRIKAMTFYIKKGKTWTSLWHHNHHNSGETVVIVFGSIRISFIDRAGEQTQQIRLFLNELSHSKTYEG